MVSKITLFEPHFDGAQIGPATLGTEGIDLELGESEAEHDSQASEPSMTSRLPSARNVIGATAFAVGLLGGLLAWRRFRGRSTAETDVSVESDDEPMLEERHVEDLTQE